MNCTRCQARLVGKPVDHILTCGCGKRNQLTPDDRELAPAVVLVVHDADHESKVPQLGEVPHG